MRFKVRDNYSFLAVFTIFALVLSGCQMPASGTPAPDQSTQLTQLAEAAFAQLTQTSLDATSVAEMIIPATQTQAAIEQLGTKAPPATSTIIPTSAPTTAAPATATVTSPPPTATNVPPTSTPELPTATPSLAVGELVAEIDTNCRQGPGGSYLWISGLRAGRSAEVYGRDFSGEWWYIARPGGKADEYCWVWGESTDVIGEDDALPVIPPFPVQLNPTVSQWNFAIDGVNIANCGEPTAHLLVDFLLSTRLESGRLVLYDASDNDVIYDSGVDNAPFLGSDQTCGSGFDWLSGPGLAYVAGGLGKGRSDHMVAASLQLCEEDFLDGRCYYATSTFTVP